MMFQDFTGFFSLEWILQDFLGFFNKRSLPMQRNFVFRGYVERAAFFR
jgi:hypothetical protein